MGKIEGLVRERLGAYLNTMVADLHIEGKGQYLRDLFGKFEDEVVAALASEGQGGGLTVQDLNTALAHARWTGEFNPQKCVNELNATLASRLNASRETPRKEMCVCCYGSPEDHAKQTTHCAHCDAATLAAAPPQPYAPAGEPRQGDWPGGNEPFPNAAENELIESTLQKGGWDCYAQRDVAPAPPEPSKESRERADELAVNGFLDAVKWLQENGYGDWDGTANGQTITLTGCANRMRDYADLAIFQERERCARVAEGMGFLATATAIRALATTPRPGSGGA